MEIVERHHRLEENAPSGTALKFGQIIAGIMGQTAARPSEPTTGRPGEPPRDEIGYHAIRSGDNPGEHTIIFGLPGETIGSRTAPPTATATPPAALAAAKFLVGEHGLYGMEDVLRF